MMDDGSDLKLEDLETSEKKAKMRFWKVGPLLAGGAVVLVLLLAGMSKPKEEAKESGEVKIEEVETEEETRMEKEAKAPKDSKSNTSSPVNSSPSSPSSLQITQLTQELEELQNKYDAAVEYYNRLQMKQDQWNLSLGGMVSNPIGSDFKFDPTVTGLVGLGPAKWKVLTGVGYNSDDGMSLSLGYLWNMGTLNLNK